MELAADLLERGKASLKRLRLPVSEIAFLFSEVDFAFWMPGVVLIGTLVRALAAPAGLLFHLLTCNSNPNCLQYSWMASMIS